MTIIVPNSIAVLVGFHSISQRIQGDNEWEEMPQEPSDGPSTSVLDPHMGAKIRAANPKLDAARAERDTSKRILLP